MFTLLHTCSSMGLILKVLFSQGSVVFTRQRYLLSLQIEVIGGAEKYLAVCRACYKSPVKVSPRCSPLTKNTPRTTCVPEIEAAAASRRLFGTPLLNVMDVN